MKGTDAQQFRRTREVYNFIVSSALENADIPVEAPRQMMIISS